MTNSNKNDLIENLSGEGKSRRKFLKSSAATSGLVLGVMVTGVAGCAPEKMAGNTVSEMNLFLAIAENGDVTITAMSPEIGQGSRTAMPTIVCEELEADWDRVTIVQAGPDPRLGDQSVGGSSAIRENYDNMRRAGAVARTMLETAAANMWGVDASECKAENHVVKHTSSNKSAGFGELAIAASKLPVPDKATVTLKDKADFKLIGKALGPVDGKDIAMGKATYGIDVVVPDMRFAVMVRSPVLGGKVKSFNADAAKAVKGVEAVLEIGAPHEPPMFNSIGGIAVVANNTWTAKKAAALLEITWDASKHDGYDSAGYRKMMEAEVAKPGTVARNKGDFDAAFKGAAKTIEADYYVPHHHHMSMEAPAAVADVKVDGAEIWMPTQGPQGALGTLAAALGLEPTKVKIHVMLSGGAFGRKSKPDYAVEAALISKEIGKPVKMTWSREDDVKHGYYHACCAQSLKAGLDGDGNPVAYLHRTAFPTIGSTFAANATAPMGFETDLGLQDMPYDIPNIRAEFGSAEAHVRIGWVRSVNNINHAFAVGSFMDEIAQDGGKDSAEFLLKMLGDPREIDFASEQTNEYGNYGKDIKEYPADTGRMAGVIKKAMESSGWGKDMPADTGMGIAMHRSFLTNVACVVEVAIVDDELTIPRVWYAVDCGQAVNTDRIKAQFEGGAIFGMSVAFAEGITAEGGAVQQGNFDDYIVPRMPEAPYVHVDIIDSDELPTGVGEPPVPPFAAALTNAIFQATGKRIRSLPIGDQYKA
jgi:isoquinoline 1-oxidoreductase beta subunit